MTYGTALGVYNYLGEETEFVPWAAAIDNLAYLKEMFARTGGYGALKARFVLCFRPIFSPQTVYSLIIAYTTSVSLPQLRTTCWTFWCRFTTR